MSSVVSAPKRLRLISLPSDLFHPLSDLQQVKMLDLGANLGFQGNAVIKRAVQTHITVTRHADSGG